MVGAGTAINVVAILVGSALGVALGHRLPERTRDVVTDGLGLITMLVAALSAAAVLDPALHDAVGSAGVLIVLGAVLVGGIVGSLLRVEERLEGVGEWIRSLLVRRRGDASRAAHAAIVARPGVHGDGDGDVDGVDGDGDGELDSRDVDGVRTTTESEPAPDDAEHAAARRFVDGFVTASLVFCVGPLAILGSLSDGLGRGLDQLALKAVLDGFASVAFAASLGWGVAASALAVGLWQGLWTLLGWSLGGVLPDAEIAALTATGGLLLAGISIRLLRIRAVPVGDLLPALLVAPLLVWIVTSFR